MMYSESEERFSNLVLISINEGFLKTMKIENSADAFYYKGIDEFAKKKRKIELLNT